MSMGFRSTRGGREARTFKPAEALELGLAPDGGLFVPAEWPILPEDLLLTGGKLSFPEFAGRLLRFFFTGDPLANRLEEICARAFNFPLVIRPTAPDLKILELFHGPTCAFKDFGARFLARCLAERTDWAAPPMVLVATSGDTGGAVASAFSELTSIPAVVLFPSGRISPEQERQLSVWGPSVRAFSVQGSFDDCQRLVKGAFRDPELRAARTLLSANSINVGRLLPQMAYLAYTSLSLAKTPPRGFIIPSGNLGHGTAGLWARRLGFPMGKIVFAHNANRTFPDYLSTGQWRPRPSLATLANAMDVGDPSNFERIRDLYGDANTLRDAAEATSIKDEAIKSLIHDRFAAYGEIFCPHTATGIEASRTLGPGPWVVAATAHPAKFREIVEPLIGRAPPLPRPLEALQTRMAVSEPLPANPDSLKRILL